MTKDIQLIHCSFCSLNTNMLRDEEMVVADKQLFVALNMMIQPAICSRCIIVAFGRVAEARLEKLRRKNVREVREVRKDGSPDGRDDGARGSLPGPVDGGLRGGSVGAGEAHGEQGAGAGATQGDDRGDAAPAAEAIGTCYCGGPWNAASGYCSACGGRVGMIR